jgi:hypothetical protein
MAMMKLTAKILLVVVLLAGLGLAATYFFGSKRVCVNGENICLLYQKPWKKEAATASINVRLTASNPAGLFQVSVQHKKLTGSVNAVATALDIQLKKQAASYKLLQSNEIVVSNVRAVEMVYEFRTQDGGTVRESMVVAPIGGISYFFTCEAAVKDYDALKPGFDYLLQHVRIKT